jgi:hypothetical protein
MGQCRILTTAASQFRSRLVGRWPRSWGAWALAACVWVAPSGARAEPEQYVDLKYEVDPDVDGCLSDSAFRTVVTRRLGYDPHRAGSTPSVEVRVWAAETGIEGSIEWIWTGERRIGERRFTSPSRDCHDMTVTMAFVVAVQTQLMATEPGAEEPPETMDTEPEPSDRSTPVEPVEPPVAREPSVPVATPREPPSAERQPAHWFAQAGIGPEVGVGLGRHAVGLGRFFLSLHREWIGVELGAEATLPSATDGDGEAGFRHDLILATLAACGARGPFAACGLGKLGRIRVSGTGVDNPASPKGLVGQAGMRLSYSLRMPNHLALHGHLDGLYLVTPWTVDLNQVAVWTMPRLSAIAGVDLTLRFP